jgi:hypothetical protein
MILNSPTISGSLTVTGNILTSGSITLSGSVASASFADTASFVALAQSASNAVSAATASFANAFTVAGTLTAQTLVVQTITSSVDFVTGSTRFGSIAANTHVFTGSMSVSGSSATFSGNMGIGGISSADIIGYGTNGILGILGAAGNPASIQLGVTGTAAATTTLLGDVNVFGLNGGSSVVARTIIRSSLDGATNSTKMDFFTMNSGTLASRLTIASTGAATFSSSVTAANFSSSPLSIAPYLDLTYNSTAGLKLTYDAASAISYIDNYYHDTVSSQPYGDISFRTKRSGVNTLVDALIIKGFTGNVGIGLIDPANKLQVNVSSNATTLYNDNSYPLQIKNTSTTNNSYVGMYFGTGLGVGVTIQALYTNASTNSEGNLLFSTRNSGGSLAERMRITSSGAVLVGTTTDNGSGGILQVNGIIDGTTFSASRTLTVNADNEKKCGMYRWNSDSTNLPEAGFFSVIIYGNGDNVTAQMATHFQNANTYVRAFNASWTAWRRII